VCNDRIPANVTLSAFQWKKIDKSESVDVVLIAALPINPITSVRANIGNGQGELESR
jgi:hypothetical protein